MNIPPLTTAARKVVLASNAQTGCLPFAKKTGIKGIDPRVLAELRSYELVAEVGLTLRGRMVRQAIMDEELSF